MKNIIYISLILLSVTTYGQLKPHVQTLDTAYNFQFNGVTEITIDTASRITIKRGNKTTQLYMRGDSVYIKAHDSIFLLTSRLQMGSQHLTATDTTQCTTAGVYYKIYQSGGFADAINNNFTIDTNGKITFTGTNGTRSVLTGVSDLTADKVCQVTYALYKNGSIVSTATTPVDINNPGKSKGISITRGVLLRKNDYFEVYVKTDVSNTIVTHNSLSLSFVCDR